MPDLKCVDCRIRVRTQGEAAPERCPICEAHLELVEDLSEVVGFRAMGRPIEGLPAERFADRVSDLTQRRDEQIMRLRVAAERWLDEAGSFDPRRSTRSRRGRTDDPSPNRRGPMSILRRRQARPTQDNRPATPAGDGAPIPGYDRLDPKEIAGRLPKLTQLELAGVEAHERAHRNRPVVLDKLRYLRSTEPLPGYDALEADEIIAALAGANGQTLRAVRDYERKFRRRQTIATAIAAMLPSSTLSASEARAQAEKDERVRSRPEPGTQP
jgi:hypothetical protein